MGLDEVVVFVVALLFFESIAYLYWRERSKQKA
jgi:hypothetical protein